MDLYIKKYKVCRLVLYLSDFGVSVYLNIWSIQNLKILPTSRDICILSLYTIAVSCHRNLRSGFIILCIFDSYFGLKILRQIKLSLSGDLTQATSNTIYKIRNKNVIVLTNKCVTIAEIFVL